jgi:2-iminobutanoate/2-iminopropanoate deaminase
MTRQTTHVDPAELHHNPAFTQGVIAPAGPTLYVGGQNGTDSHGELAEGIEAQTTQAMSNVLAVLAAAGTGPEHVYLTSGIDPRAAFGASQSVWGNHRTAISVLIVADLAVPGALVEVDAIALIP